MDCAAAPAHSTDRSHPSVAVNLPPSIAIPTGRPARRLALPSSGWRSAAVLLVLSMAGAAPPAVAGEPIVAPADTLPKDLRDTGLYAPGSGREIAAGIAAFSPQYPLWSDGADKHRWLSIPAGSFIDASRPDEWRFPAGTRLWKEFAHAGRPIETRFIARRDDGSWQFATYVWNVDASEALLAPQRGIAALSAPGAPGGHYAIPGRGDCLACHGSGAVPVLGVSAL
jgi:hypothetical protein